MGGCNGCLGKMGNYSERIWKRGKVRKVSDESEKTSNKSISLIYQLGSQYKFMSRRKAYIYGWM